jgi:hypothetical protein
MRLRFHAFLRRLKVIGSLAFNIVQFFAALIAIITTAAGAGFIAWFFHFQGFLIALLAFLFGVFVTFLLMIFFLLRASPPRWVLQGYKHVRIDILYVIHADDPKHHTLTMETEIEALKSGVSIYEDTYQWTGQGEEDEPKVVSAGHTLMGKIIKRDGWKYTYIHLEHELTRGARTTIKTIQELYDSANNFEPFLGRVVFIPIDSMVLHVILPKALFPAHIYFREWDAPLPAGRIIREIPGKINMHSGEIHWEIQSPVFRHRYSIDWKY